jgi:hypothetical protein
VKIYFSTIVAASLHAASGGWNRYGDAFFLWNWWTNMIKVELAKDQKKIRSYILKRIKEYSVYVTCASPNELVAMPQSAKMARSRSPLTTQMEICCKS